MTRSCTRINTFVLACLVALTSACQDRTTGAGRGTWGYSPSEPQPNPALQTFVDSKTLDTVVAAPEMPANERKHLVEQVRSVYKNHNYQFIWIDGDSLSNRYQQFAKALDSADDHGLPRALYPLPIQDPSARDLSIGPDRAPEIDARVTATFLRYFTHLTSGRLDPRTLQSLWTLKPQRPDLAAALSAALANNDLPATMERLEPQHPEYRELQKALTRYRAIAAKGGWPVIPAKMRLKPNQQSPAVPALRQRLAIEGDLDPSHEKDPSPTFDPIVVDAVKRFEERHRIEPDGIVDPATVTALNVPVHERIRTIQLNLERWRWLPDQMPA